MSTPFFNYKPKWAGINNLHSGFRQRAIEIVGFEENRSNTHSHTERVRLWLRLRCGNAETGFLSAKLCTRSFFDFPSRLFLPFFCLCKLFYINKEWERNASGRADRSSGFLKRLEKTEKGFQRRSQKLNENSLLERISTTVAGLRSRRSARLEGGEHVLCEFCCTNWRRTLFRWTLKFLYLHENVYVTCDMEFMMMTVRLRAYA